MAMIDYRLRDVCGCKTFYDADLGWEVADPALPPIRYANPDNAMGGRLHKLGDWAVLCVECSKTHETIITRKNAAETA